MIIENKGETTEREAKEIQQKGVSKDINIVVRPQCETQNDTQKTTQKNVTK